VEGETQRQELKRDNKRKKELNQSITKGLGGEGLWEGMEYIE
jgi:hypothetical protein